MKLLVITQKIDATDANLGFFVRWIEQLAESADITVIANEVHPDASRYVPNDRVRLYSLGKEKGASRLARFIRYQRLLWRCLRQTDGVFFHMCPEYVLGAHVLPRLFRKKTMLWYVHKEVSSRLRLASVLVDKIFTASKESCRLRSEKMQVVGHGVATGIFISQPIQTHELHLVTVGRISPVKDIRTLIQGFLKVHEKYPQSQFSIFGEPITHSDTVYLDTLKKDFSSNKLFFRGKIYYGLVFSSHPYNAFVHASRTGSMDKAVLEALAAGLPVFTSSEAFTEAMGVRKFREGDAADFADKISRAFSRGELVTNTAGSAYVREHHSLSRLIKKILSFYDRTYAVSAF